MGNSVTKVITRFRQSRCLSGWISLLLLLLALQLKTSLCAEVVTTNTQQPVHQRLLPRHTTSKEGGWQSVMGTSRPQHRVLALQSRYVNDEVKEVMTTTNDTTNDNPSVINIAPSFLAGTTSVEAIKTQPQLVPWNKERKTLNHVVSSCLTLAIWGLLAHQLFMPPSSMSSPSLLLGVSYRTWLCLFVLSYIVEASSCSTRRYLSNMLSPVELLDAVRDMCQSPPIVRWKLECYHYNHKGHHYYTKGGQKYVGDESNRVVTHRASRSFQYNRWKDVTDLERLQQAIEYDSDRGKICFLKVTLVKLLLFAAECAAGTQGGLESYRMQRDQFLMQEGHRDTHTSMKTMLEVQGFKPKLLGVRTVVGGPGTGRHRLSFYWLFTALGLTVPYRIWFERRCDRIEVVIAKEV